MTCPLSLQPHGSVFLLYNLTIFQILPTPLWESNFLLARRPLWEKMWTQRMLLPPSGLLYSPIVHLLKHIY